MILHRSEDAILERPTGPRLMTQVRKIYVKRNFSTNQFLLFLKSCSVGSPEHHQVFPNILSRVPLMPLKSLTIHKGFLNSHKVSHNESLKSLKCFQRRLKCPYRSPKVPKMSPKAVKFPNMSQKSPKMSL